jgi:hypothetical protein
VAFEHHDGLSRTFVTNCSAHATTGKGNVHVRVSPSFQWVSNRSCSPSVP